MLYHCINYLTTTLDIRPMGEHLGSHPAGLQHLLQQVTYSSPINPDPSDPTNHSPMFIRSEFGPDPAHVALGSPPGQATAAWGAQSSPILTSTSKLKHSTQVPRVDRVPHGEAQHHQQLRGGNNQHELHHLGEVPCDVQKGRSWGLWQLGVLYLYKYIYYPLTKLFTFIIKDS